MYGLAPETCSFAGRILLSALLGGIIRIERDIHGRAAGLRTHLLVSVGSALFTIISMIMAKYNLPEMSGLSVTADPSRIAAQIVTGIGFLGAGAIIKEGFTIRGLTTAACLWIAAAIGMAAGAGAYAMAIFTTFLAIMSLIFLHLFEKSISRDSYRSLIIKTALDTDMSKIIETVRKQNIKILYLDFDRDYEKKVLTIKLSLRLFHKGITDKLSHTIVKSIEAANIPLNSIRWTRS